MKLTLSWLQEFVDIPWHPDELANKLTALGIEVESYHYLGEAIKDIIVGEVRSVEKHPQADKLLVTKVWDGQQELQVISGAPNTNVGGKYPLARIDVILPGGLKLKKTKIRGLESEGMLCAEDELGLSNNHSGLIELPEKAEAGEKVAGYLGLDDWLFDLEITPNRGDWFGIIGIARELAAIQGISIRYPEYTVHKKINKPFPIRIEDTEGCPRYSGKVISGIKVEDSPDWLKARLKAIGLRPINNVVDISNYIMWETGQPLHAFDFAKLIGPEIVVRKAYEGEKILGLDDKEYSLDEEILVIADKNNPVAIAGVLGGLKTSVTKETTSLLLECAHFDPVRVRIGSTKLDINTDSATRFSRGVDPENVKVVADYFASMILQIAGGKVASDLIDENPNPWLPKQIELRIDRVQMILGAEVPEEAIHSSLKNLELELKKTTPNTYQVTIPGFRLDLEREIDLIEEIARIWGYDNILVDIRVRKGARKNNVHREMMLHKIREFFKNNGFTETMTWSISDSRWLDKLSLSENDYRRNIVVIADLEKKEDRVLISSLVPKMLDTIAYNQARQNHNLKVFEIGKTFWLENNLPKEGLRLTIGVVGEASPLSWNQLSCEFDLFDLKGIWEVFRSNILVDNRFADYYTLPENQSTYFTNNWLGLKFNDNPIGEIGELKQEICNNWDILGKVVILDVSLEEILIAQKNENQYKAISPFPSVRRDIALTVPSDVTADQIERLIKMNSSKYLEKVALFDRFVGLAEGKIGLAFALWFRSDKATLREEEVDKWVEKILSRLDHELKVVLRI
jgi:phenylalanyl-tRNA synthetase beta chain